MVLRGSFGFIKAWAALEDAFGGGSFFGSGLGISWLGVTGHRDPAELILLLHCHLQLELDRIFQGYSGLAPWCTLPSERRLPLFPFLFILSAAAVPLRPIFRGQRRLMRKWEHLASKCVNRLGWSYNLRRCQRSSRIRVAAVLITILKIDSALILQNLNTTISPILGFFLIT